MGQKLTPTQKIWAVLVSLCLATVSMGAFIGCNSPRPNVSKTKTTSQFDDKNRPIDIVVIESCEYIYGSWGYATVLTHKGNCKNPKHQK